MNNYNIINYYITLHMPVIGIIGCCRYALANILSVHACIGLSLYIELTLTKPLHPLQ